MKLIWQIVKKDLRLMAWPVGLWIILLLATTAEFGALRLPAELQRMSPPNNWAMGVGQFFLIATVLLEFAGAVLAGILAQEDSPVGTTAFWLTRPIAGARLLAAKTVGATLLLVIAPTVGMAAVWAAEGFSVREIGAAALEFMAWQAVMILPALAIGAATANLGRFLFTALGAAVVFVVCETNFVQFWGQVSYDMRLARSRTLVVLIVALAGSLVVLGWRYLSRHGRPAWILATTMGSMIVAGGTWSVDLTEAWPWLGLKGWHSHRGPASAEEMQVRTTWDKLLVRDGDSALTLKVSNAKIADEIFAPTSAWVRIHQATRRGTTMDYICDRGARWGEAASLHLAGLAKDDAPFTWEIGVGRFAEAVAGLRREREVLAGSVVKMVRMRPRVMWELPLRAGEEVRVGSSFTRIVELAWIKGQHTVLLHERDARLSLVDKLRFPSYYERRTDDAKVDCFLVVNRAQGFAQAASLDDLGVAHMNSMMISISSLRLPSGERGQPAAWEQGATLIKVRFERDGFFNSWVPGGPITVAEESKP